MINEEIQPASSQSLNDLNKRDSNEDPAMEIEGSATKPLNTDEAPDDGLVVTKRASHRIHSDRMEKMWEEMNRKEQLPQKFERREPLLKHISETEKRKVQQFGNISEAGTQHLQRLIQKYKFSNSNRFVIDSTEKVRSDLKEKMISYLLYAVQELKEVHSNLTSRELEIVDSTDSQQIQLTRRLAIETEINLLKYFNKDLRGKIERNYRDRANTILINLRDEANLELRRKIISGAMDPSKLATVDEFQLFTQARRDEINAKTRQQIAQTTMAIREEIEEPQEIISYDIKEPELKIQKTHSVKQKSLDHRLEKEIRELMSSHIKGFRQKIQDDLPERESDQLIGRLEEEFAQFMSI